MDTQRSDKKPWYQEPFVWMVIFFPLMAVIGGIITIRLAILSNDGLVVDDYYKRGMEINLVLNRDKAAAHHGLFANMTWNKSADNILLTLWANEGYELPKTLNLHFMHSTRAGFDLQLDLQKMAENNYQAALPSLPAGKWYVELSAEDWRLQQAIRLPLSMTRQFQFRPAV